MFGIIPEAAAVEARREVLHGRLRQHLKNVGQSRGYLTRLQGFLDKLRHALFNSHFSAQATRDARTLRLHSGDKIEGLLHGREIVARSGLLAQAHKRRAHQPLQLRVLLNAQAQT